jgi:UDP-glucose 4-epimerase
MRVLVTGGAGFIGANLCRTLVAHGHEVTVLDDLSTGLESNLDAVARDIAFRRGSILDEGLVGRLVPHTDAVVHLAARPSVARSVDDPMASHRVNVDGTLCLLEAARRAATLPLVVFASSSSVYGANPALPKHEELATRPRSPYAASKLAAEGYVLAYQATYGVPALALRFFNVFGPLQTAGHAYAAVIPAFVDAALNDRPLVVHGDGLQTRDFTFVDTVTEIITDAVERRVDCASPVNLAFGTRTSILDVANAIGELLGIQLSFEHVHPRAGDVRDSQAANDLLRELFPGVEPVALRDGLSRTINWARSSGEGAQRLA